MRNPRRTRPTRVPATAPMIGPADKLEPTDAAEAVALVVPKLSVPVGVRSSVELVN